MKIVITGGRGQLGRELARVLSGRHEVAILDLPECDITQREEIDNLVAMKPNLIIHTAAMTDVDGCARNPLAAYRANALGTQNVALACQRANATLVHISTNEVFDGTKRSAYLEMDERRAINAYGASKLAAERFVQMFCEKYYIVRIAWLFAPGGNNFPKRIVEAANQRGALNVVSDEIANPTYAPDLVQGLEQLIETRHYGIVHLTNEGIASRFDFTSQILKSAGLGHIPLTPILLADYERASTPPPYAPLANVIAGEVLNIRLRPWQEALEAYFHETRNSTSA